MSQGLFGRLPAAPFGKLFVRDADKARALAASGGDPAEAVIEVDADVVTLDQSAFSNGSVDFEVDGDLVVPADSAPAVEPVFELGEESEPVVEPVFEEAVEVEETETEAEAEAEAVSPFQPAEGFVAPSKRGRPKKTQA